MNEKCQRPRKKFDENNVTINSYNKTAYEYFKQVSSFITLPEIDLFTELVAPGGKVLDVGCGPGQHSKIFSKYFQVIGIDLSPEMIKIAEKEAPNAEFFVQDLKSLNFEEETFDGVWASASLLHIPKNEIKEVLLKLKKQLKDSGIFYASFKEGNGEEIFVDKRYEGVKKFYAYYNETELIQLFDSIGFEIIKKDNREKRKEYDTNSWLHYFCKKA